MSDNIKLLVGSGSCCCFLVAAIVILSLSFARVEQTEWGLKYSWWSESVDPEPIVDAGVIMVGMGNYLLRFPNTNMYCYFRNFEASMSRESNDVYMPPIDVRTSDGLAIQLELEFVYRLQKHKLRDLFMLVGPDSAEETANFRSFMVNTALGVLDTYATTFSAKDFYSSREKVANVFQQELTRVLSSELYIDLQSLQLQPAHFPKQFADAIVTTQEKKQDIQVAAQEQETSRIQQMTRLANIKALAQKQTIDAEANASKIRLDAQARNSQYVYKQTKLAEGYQKALSHFTQGGAEAAGMTKFMQYMHVEAMKSHSSAKTMVRLSALNV